MIKLNSNLGFILIGVYVLMSIVLLVVMGVDKKRSKNHGRRVPENTLFTLALLGGAMGGILGMQLFRHKTKKMKFMVGFPILALLQWGVAIWMLLPE